ncbi:MAG: hypothetical protein DWQ02_13555 [Bacteroidetes bacterium]|nr:MAG: hypothetical protein DWQ02_13555 [Bacteroidota bacterium]
MNELKWWLRANATFSAFSGLVLIFGNRFLQGFFGFENAYVLPVLAVGLLIFGGFVFLVSKQEPVDEKQVNSISIADAGWVLGSALLCVFRPFGLTTGAYVVIIIVALIVGLFGIQQYRYNSRESVRN